MPGSEPAAHCYCGHQFGSFAGQLRQADGHKAQRSSIREFLCSEAVFALGVPTTRAGSLVTAMWYETCTTEGTPLKRGALLPSASHPPLSGSGPLRSLRWLMRTQAGRAPAMATMRSEVR
uniref:Selenoprotein O n=1 Tax=Oncorhynchus tshawytscha TaxID=74940 RepID=A0AAZ3PRT5_ONCTS